ncbi:MAG: knotted carbamoyltransferase YgeW [Deltaproteobacteria bacterium]|nr:knotted carbamoyltransferase YgeW [Deltaproteobacteria bacterium]
MSKAQIQPLLDKLSTLKPDLYNKDFLLTWAQSQDDLLSVLTVAETLENFYRANIATRAFQGGLAVSNFRDNSTRTRFSFASAASLLGLSVQDLDETKSQVAHGETVRETANMISFVTEVIGIRDDLYVGYGHEYQQAVSDAVQQGFTEGVLPQRPGVINLQCDRDHPTQSMTDLLHLKQTFGSLENLRGKKVAMTWAYSPSYGKPLSVAQGTIGLLTRFGMDVTLAHPEGYDVMPDIMDTAAQQAKASGGSFKLTHSMDDAFEDADIVYPKSWAPMSIMVERTDLLKSGRGKEVQALEKKAIALNGSHMDWQATEARMARTKAGKGLYMHCLPADITGVSCDQGEVDATVFDRYWRETYHEAEHKLYIIAAMMMLTRFPDAHAVLQGLLDEGRPRRFGQPIR